MKKRMGSVLLLLGLLLITIFNENKRIKADVIWEPEDDFYREHTDECTYVNRSYTSNGEKGYIIVYRSPIQNKKIDALINGSTLHVSFSYDKDGEIWGVINYDKKGDDTVEPAYAGGTTGWVRLEELNVVYDEISFREDHTGQIQSYSGDFDTYEIKEQIYIWTYPGSGEALNKIDKTTWDNKENAPNLSECYTDEDGREWGYVGYYYGMGGWICISDPENEKLPIKQHAKEEEFTPVEPPKDILKSQEQEERLEEGILIGIVAGVVIITALLLLRLRKKTEV
ncbi:hypothetical protein [Anaerosporobacter faecicola]|uniref:hypothetical protein n=1 Tax=Anaerosporobacter faecicola TaxID=2718714 RepID=UPI00143B6E11|nr:hypothetical protein [Anaerosporobacter faecicola]